MNNYGVAPATFFGFVDIFGYFMMLAYLALVILLCVLLVKAIKFLDTSNRELPIIRKVLTKVAEKYCYDNIEEDESNIAG